MKILRAKMRMTQKQLAVRIRVSQAYISKLENGNIDSLTINKIVKLSHILGVSPACLLEKLLSTRK